VRGASGLMRKGLHSELYAPNNYVPVLSQGNDRDGMGGCGVGLGLVRPEAKKVWGGGRRKPLSSRARMRWRFYVRIVVID
jgi:hypothetical protein